MPMFMYCPAESPVWQSPGSLMSAPIPIPPPNCARKPAQPLVATSKKRRPRSEAGRLTGLSSVLRHADQVPGARGMRAAVELVHLARGVREVLVGSRGVDRVPGIRDADLHAARLAVDRDVIDAVRVALVDRLLHDVGELLDGD